MSGLLDGLRRLIDGGAASRRLGPTTRGLEAEAARLAAAERAAADLAALADLEREMVSELDPERLLALLVAHAGRLFDGPSVIWLLDGDHLVRAASSSAPTVEGDVPLGAGVVGACASGRRGLLVNDYPSSPLAWRTAVELGVRHAVAQPLLVGEALLGAIGVSRVGPEAPPFVADDLDRLGRFATGAALALRNARLFAAERAARLEADRSATALAESEERYRTLVDASIQATFLHQDEIIRAVNPAMARLLGYDPEEDLIGRSIWDFGDPSTRPRVDQYREARLAGRPAPGAYESRVVRRDGTVIDVEVAVALTRLGDRPAFLVSFVDISARRLAEAAVRRQMALLEVAREIDLANLAAASPRDVAVASLARLDPLVPSSSSGAFLFDRALTELTALALHGDPFLGLSEGDRMPLDASPQTIGSLAAGTTLVMSDSDVSSPIGLALVERGMRTLLLAPLVVGGVTMGVLVLASGTRGAFDADAVAAASEVARGVALAIRHAELFAQLEDLSRRLIETQEAERRALARELHDQMGQDLTATKLTLQMTARRSGTDLREAVGAIDELIGRVRELSLTLRPSMLDDLGLPPTLRWLAARFEERTGVRVALELSGIETRLDPALETAAYRIVQEALTNVARHAGTSAAAVRVAREGGRVVVEVRDGGRGFRAGAPRPASAGLSGMRERAALLGGNLAVESSPGAGTSVRAELPAIGPGGGSAP
jgi:PAS domain S-box-containing protein